MGEKFSRYVVVSDNIYGDESGLKVKLLYATRTARTMFVIPEVAEALLGGEMASISPGTRSSMRDAQIIVPDYEDELTAILERNREASRDTSAVRFILLPTSYCNMGCTYCGQEHTRGGLTANHRARVRERVLRVLRLPGTKSARVDWFGGEPMMGYAIIRTLARDFVGAADENGVDYQSEIVTNGSLLNRRNIDVLIRECRVSKFDITIDGPAEIHDAHRPLKSGGTSFWKIVNTIREAATNPAYDGVRFEFRTNVDIHNRDSIERYIEVMSDLGFDLPNVDFSLARVRPWSNDVSAMEVDRQEFSNQELVWLRMLHDRGLTFMRLPNLAKRVTCPAVKESSELIDGKGNIFSCTDQPLVPELEKTATLGHVADLDLPVFRPKGEFDDWNDDVAAGKSWCRGCVFLPTCGGACPKLWHEGYPPCPSYKANIQGRLDLVAARLDLHPVPTGA